VIVTSKSTLKRYAAQVAKPIVIYGDLLFLKEGHSALVNRVFDHPGNEEGMVKGEGLVRTSPVVKYLGLGCFETEQTIYKPKFPLSFDKRDA
jgi:hypothetical protein